jgi:gliding motility-associated-like protein
MGIQNHRRMRSKYYIFPNSIAFAFSLPFFLCLSPLFGQSQFQVTDSETAPFTPENLISNVFLGEGVTVKSINFAGEPKAVGYFSGGANVIGLDRGIILTSGFVQGAGNVYGTDGTGQDFATNVNNSPVTDATLQNTLLGAQLRDVAVYTIRFVPTSDTLRFRYCWASEEYPEFGCTKYNDVFGFFIEGPGYPTPTNIALIPNSVLPVAINNIHPNNPTGANGPCPPFNAEFFNDNMNSNVQPVYDGFTDVFTAMAVVRPCQEYTIKLAIADAGDGAYDSGVFLEAKSFSTNSLRVSVETQSIDGAIAEGCTPGRIKFSLPKARPQDFPLDFNIWGNAQNGVDYTKIGNNLVIPAGKTELIVPIEATRDNIVENSEFMAIDIQSDPCKRDTVYIYFKDNRMLPPNKLLDTTLCESGQPIVLNGTLPIVVPPVPSFTNTQDLNIPNPSLGNFSPSVTSTLNVSGVLPVFLAPGVIESVCFNITHPWVDDLDITLVSPSGAFIELTSDNGGSGNNFTNTCFTPKATRDIKTAATANAPFTGDWLPENPFSTLWSSKNLSNGTWKLLLKDDTPFSPGTLRDWTINFAPTYKIGYEWTPAAGLSCTNCPTPSMTPTQKATYLFKAVDSYGCAILDTVNVNVGKALAAPTVACSDTTGDKTTFSWGPVPSANGYEVNIDNKGWINASNATSHTIGGLKTSTLSNISVRAKGEENSDCSVVASSTCLNCAPIPTVVKTTPVSCTGLSDGGVSFKPDSLNPPYTYVLGAQSNNTGIFQGLAKGAYTASVKDAFGCETKVVFSIAEPLPVKAAAKIQKPVSCFGGSDGSLAAEAVGGGTGPYLYKWNDLSGQTSATASNLKAGSYILTVTDSKGCTATATAAMTQPTEIQASAVPVPVDCYGDKNGRIALTPSGGSGAFEASWIGPGAYTGKGLTINGLSAGVYQATVTDAAKCTKQISAEVKQPDSLVVDLPAVSDTVCFLGTDGTATAIPVGGTGPYAYLWNVDQKSQTAAGLPVGEYKVTVTDSKKCAAAGSTFVLQKQQLSAWTAFENPLCHNGSDGSANVQTIFYGAESARLTNFTYLWSTTPVQNTRVATGLKADQSYTVTVSDAQGCTAVQTAKLGNPDTLIGRIVEFGNPKCAGDTDGWAAARGVGGTGPYSYLWSNGVFGTQTPDSTIGKLAAGRYRLTVTDTKGCAAVSELTLTEPDPIKIAFEKTPVKCYGGSDGTAKAIGSGGSGNFKFSWATGIQTRDLKNLPAGSYKISVTDGKGCSAVDSVTILQPKAPLSARIEKQDANCFGARDGQIKIDGLGGTPPYRFALDNGAWNGSNLKIGLKAGSYKPRVIDANGCTAEVAATEIGQRPKVEVDLGPDIYIDLGQDTVLSAEVANAAAPYVYNWNPRDSSKITCLYCERPTVKQLRFAHSFRLFVIDSLGCRGEDEVMVFVDKPRRVFVPTAFSPNDDSNNDRLVVHGQESAKIQRFRVYDRWGELVFEDNDMIINNMRGGWDGAFRGEMLNPGVYLWVLEVEYLDGETETLKGQTTLIR